MPSESPSYEELKGISASRGMLAQFSYPTLFEAKTPTSQPSTLVGCFETPQNCCRCGINFTPSKEYSPVESPPERVCRFHKRRIKRVGRSKVYECCNSTVGSTEGCEVRKWHVFEGYKRGDPFPRYPKLESTKSDLIRKAVALDAEMFYTTGGYEVSRVTVVDFFTEETIIDVMVLPRHPIVLDYNTQFSGVTAESYTSGELPVLEFAELKEKLAEIIGDSTILIGHSIDNDLQLLEFHHDLIVDTVILYPHPSRPPSRMRLNVLALDFLSERVQQGTNGHDSREDCLTCVHLVKKYISSKAGSSRR